MTQRITSEADTRNQGLEAGPGLPPGTRSINGGGEIDVSVIVPVYNAMPYLTEFLASVEEQDLPPARFEVIMVDDGSTDDGGEVLDRFAQTHSNVTVIHQENSGWPGQPRNRALGMARGRYVFFADADDRFGREALRRMVDFADLHESDVVYPRMAGLGGRSVQRKGLADQQVDADLEWATRSLSPQKLFRRSFLMDTGIRFPEGVVRLEDGIMLLQAYYHASRVSALWDYDYYFLRLRDDGQNISSRSLDPAGYTWSIGEVARIVRELDPDPERAERIGLRFFWKKSLKIYQPRRFLRMSSERRARWISEQKALVERYIPPRLSKTLPAASHARTELIRAGDTDGMVRLVRGELKMARASLLRATWTWRSSLRLSLEIGLWDAVDAEPKDYSIVIVDRDSGAVSRICVEFSGPLSPTVGVTLGESDGPTSWWRGSITIPRKQLILARPNILDLFIEGDGIADPDRSRVRVGKGARIPRKWRGVEAYATVRDRLSLRTR